MVRRAPTDAASSESIGRLSAEAKRRGRDPRGRVLAGSRSREPPAVRHDAPRDGCAVQVTDGCYPRMCGEAERRVPRAGAACPPRSGRADTSQGAAMGGGWKESEGARRDTRTARTREAADRGECAPPPSESASCHPPLPLVLAPSRSPSHAVPSACFPFSSARSAQASPAGSVAGVWNHFQYSSPISSDCIRAGRRSQAAASLAGRPVPQPRPPARD